MCSVNIKEDPVKEHRKNTKKFPLTFASALQMIMLLIYNLQPEATRVSFPFSARKRERNS